MQLTPGWLCPMCAAAKNKLGHRLPFHITAVSTVWYTTSKCCDFLYSVDFLESVDLVGSLDLVYFVFS